MSGPTPPSSVSLGLPKMNESETTPIEAMMKWTMIAPRTTRTNTPRAHRTTVATRSATIVRPDLVRRRLVGPGAAVIAWLPPG